MLRLWAVVLSANLVGTFLFALGIAKTAIFDPHTRQCFMEIGAAHLERASAPFWRAPFLPVG